MFGWGGGLPHEWVGAKKFGMSLETREIKLLWRDILGFCRDIPESPEKFERKKSSCSIFGPYQILVILVRFWPLFGLFSDLCGAVVSEFFSGILGPKALWLVSAFPN